MVAIRTATRPPAGEWEALAVPIPPKTTTLPKYLAPLDRETGGVLGRALASGDVKGGAGKVTVLYTPPKARARRVLCVGVGKGPTLNGLRDAAGAAARQADRLGVRRLVCAGFPEASTAEDPEIVRAMADGITVETHLDLRFRAVRDEDGKAGSLREVTLVCREDAKDVRDGAADGAAIGAAVVWAREQGNAPANLLTPTKLAENARRLARGRGIRVKVLGPAEQRRLGMGALIGVAQGSHEPAQLIVAEYKGRSGRPIALVGKGIMFDTGGISIKPAGNMHKMKMDMSGGAGVLATVAAAADLGLKVHVVAVVPATENMPGGRAQRPGDIVTAYNGKTIEVLNTDAEGRLVLADAVAYAEDVYKPTAIVDMATLTGAVQVALGRHAIGALGTDAKLMTKLREAGEAVGERCWELPLWDDYTAHTRSGVADLQNIGPPGEAGTIMGAAFIRQFVKDTPWVHLDIASTAWLDAAGGAPTGVGVRLLTEFLRREAGR